MAAVSSQGVQPMISSLDTTHGSPPTETARPRLSRQAPPRTERVVGLLPVLNEVETIDSVIPALSVSGPVERLLVIDDNSTDGTVEALQAARAEFPQLDVIVRTTERGLGTALLYGFGEALRRYAFDRLVVMDADLSHEPAAI